MVGRLCLEPLVDIELVPFFVLIFSCLVSLFAGMEFHAAILWGSAGDYMVVMVFSLVL